MKIKNKTLESITDKDLTKNGKLVLPNGIVHISENALKENALLKKVNIPYTVKTIESKALKNCIQLEKVNISNGIKIIPTSFLEGCSNLKKIKIPNSVCTIKEDAFKGCLSLKIVEIPATVQRIQYSRWFSECKNLKTIKHGEKIIRVAFNEEKKIVQKIKKQQSACA